LRRVAPSSVEYRQACQNVKMAKWQNGQFLGLSR
jgi:hypothetical protein